MHPSPAGSPATEADALRELFQRERAVVQLARHGQAIRLRYALVVVGLLVVFLDLRADVFVGDWRLMLASPLLTGLLNLAAHWLWARDRGAPWHFWGMLGVDTLVIGWAAAVAGPAGYLLLPFIITAAVGYASALPRAALAQLALGLLVYPAARVAGHEMAGQPVPSGMLVAEVVCLLGLGLLATRGTIGLTHRVRKTRHALAALERGDFGTRLSARALDDLGFLAMSFNSTAVALGEMVQALQTQVSERERAEARLAHQAFHDGLTGLANRVLFRERVQHALDVAGPQADRIAVLLVDLDGFKAVNDSLGHATGDLLLVEVAGRLRSVTRGSDTVARLGGDEFAILLEPLADAADAQRVAERVAAALAAPMALAETELVVGASIGIARASDLDHQPIVVAAAAGAGAAPDARDAADVAGAGHADEPGAARADQLLRNADVAMYRAKSQGKGTWVLFEPEMHALTVERLALEAELRMALERREFRLVYQPVVQLQTGRVIGLEALVRWENPRRGAVPPATFIPIAEETGLIVALGRWVLDEACRQGARWHARSGGVAGGTPLAMSVNLSGRQLQHAGIVGEVAAALHASRLPPHALTLEITESALVHDTVQVVERLQELKALGVRIAIDDFGTGYSSLSYLQRLPVDVLKIDKSFVDGVVHGRQDAALARTIVALGDSLSLRCVAEGIEERQQQSFLVSLGCEYGQGYLFSRPLEWQAVEALLEEGVAAAA